jgi:tRNA threonylcarbamoyl adenosine modification protein (Sua5/YciO/YrdC/YwlC family)
VIEDVVEAIRAGRPAIIPTDTVYGLAAAADSPEPVRRLYRLKGRGEGKPSALVAGDLEVLFACVPELRGAPRRIVERLLPGPYTLVLPNPGLRYRWLNGTTPAKIGVRVPAVTGQAKALLDEVGAVVATSANLPGRPEPRTLVEVPEELRAEIPALDVGELPGVPSTVVDFTGPEPVVVRQGAGDVEAALAAAS